MNKNNQKLLDIITTYLDEDEIQTSLLLSKISNELTSYRLEKNMTQKEFAKFLKVSQGMVSKMESEEYNFSISTLVKLFNKIGKKFDIIFNSKNNDIIKEEKQVTHYIITKPYTSDICYDSTINNYSNTNLNKKNYISQNL